MLYMFIVFDSVTHICYDICFSEADAIIKSDTLNFALKVNDIIYRRVNLDYLIDDYFPNNEETMNMNFEDN